VLVNGKRLGASTSGLQDLSQIPMSAVERIDVLKDGASVLYGSDAIAGVINIITRKSVEGLELSAQHGQFSQGDGKDSTFSLVTGARGERGGYTWPWNRRPTRCSPATAGSPSMVVRGRVIRARAGATSARTAPGVTRRFTTVPPEIRVQDTQSWWRPKNPNDYHPITPAEYSNGNEQMHVQTGIERRSLFLSSDYALSDQITFTTDIGYNERISDQQIAGYPTNRPSSGRRWPATGAFNPVGHDIAFNRRLWELPRTTESKLKSLRVAPTLSGYFELASKTFDWEVGALFNRNEVTKTGRGDMSLIASRQALGQSLLMATVWHAVAAQVHRSPAAWPGIRCCRTALLAPARLPTRNCSASCSHVHRYRHHQDPKLLRQHLRPGAGTAGGRALGGDGLPVPQGRRSLRSRRLCPVAPEHCTGGTDHCRRLQPQ
jgi:iron complex outermembrane receptor protein